MPPFPLNLIGEIFHLFFILMANLLALIIFILTTIHVPGTLGLAVIILTVLIRFLLWPFMATQIRTSRKMAELKPHLDALKKKHTDKKELALAQSQLYKEHGISPASGCLPALLQLPIIYSLYQSILALINSKNGLDTLNQVILNPLWHLKSIPNTSFLGFNLASRPSEFSKYGWIVLLIPVLTAALQFIQSSMMLSTTQVKPYPSDSPKEKKEKEEAEDTMTAVNSQMRYMMPLMIGYFAFNFPIGLALYWNTFTVLGIWQQYLISGWGNVGGWKGKIARVPQTKVKIERGQ